MNIKRIAGKTHGEILLMQVSKRCRWYKTILSKEKEEAMKIVNIAMRTKMSVAKIGENNPAKRLEVRAKLSVASAGKNNPSWKGGPIEYICENCGKTFVRERDGKHVYQFCSKKCKGKYYKGILGSNWQGGKSFEPYGIKFNNELKEQVRQRDSYTCQECNKTQEKLGRKLDVHHIDYNKKNNNLNNLICLCHSCHMKTNYNREDWTIYFRRKIDGANQV